jgi:uncharacterized protein YheU (UPF0270 family)
MIIPHQSINVETLRNIIEEYVTREGTDYGDVELSIEDKVSAVEAKLQSGEVVVLYIESTESINIVDKQLLS